MKLFILFMIDMKKFIICELYFCFVVYIFFECVMLMFDNNGCLSCDINICGK